MFEMPVDQCASISIHIERAGILTLAHSKVAEKAGKQAQVMEVVNHLTKKVYFRDRAMGHHKVIHIRRLRLALCMSISQ